MGHLKLSNLILFVLASFSMSLAYAQTSTAQAQPPQGSMGQNSASKQATGRSTFKKKQTANSEDMTFKIGAEAAAQGYSSYSKADSGATQQVEVNLNLKKQGAFFSNTEITIGTFSTPQSFYYAAPEAYIGYGDKYASVTVGRKIENLSFADSFYNLGLVQPYMSNDTINFKQQGLVSLAGHAYNGSFGVNAGFNPVFLPNQGPQATAKDGQIVSSNRWAQTAPEKFRFGDQNQEIIYAISDYNLTDILAHTGFYVNAYLGTSQDRPVLNATYANKPVNELALSRETFADISTFKGNVILTPVVLNHQVYSLDLNMDSGLLKTTLSFLADEPQNVKAADSQTMQTLSPLSMASFYAGYNLSSLVNRNLEVYAAYAQISGGEIKDINSDGASSSFSFSSSRSRFKNPVRVGMKSDMFYAYGRAIKADANFTYDQEYHGSLLSAQIQYSPNDQLRLSVGADLIGVETESTSATAQTNYLDQNKANDRITAGVAYAF